MSLVFCLNIVIWIHGPWSTPTQPRYSWENNSWLFQSYQLEDNYHQSAGGKRGQWIYLREGLPTNWSAHPSIHPVYWDLTSVGMFIAISDQCKWDKLTTISEYWDKLHMGIFSITHQGPRQWGRFFWDLTRIVGYLFQLSHFDHRWEAVNVSVHSRLEAVYAVHCTDILSELAGKYWFCGVTDGSSISKALICQ